MKVYVCALLDYDSFEITGVFSSLEKSIESLKKIMIEKGEDLAGLIEEYEIDMNEECNNYYNVMLSKNEKKEKCVKVTKANDWKTCKIY